MTYSKIFLTITSLFLFSLSVKAEWIEINNIDKDILQKRNIKAIYLDDKSVHKQDDSLYFALRYYTGELNDTVMVIQSKGKAVGMVEKYTMKDYSDQVYYSSKSAADELINKAQALTSSGIYSRNDLQNLSANPTNIKQKYQHPAYTTQTAKTFKEPKENTPIYAANEQAWKIANEKYSATGVVKNTAKGFVKDTINDTKAKGIIRGLTNVLKEFDSY